MVEGETFVVEAHEVEHRGVHVVDVDLVFNAVISEVVGHTMRNAALYAASGHPHREAVASVLAAVAELSVRGASELTAPQNQRVVEQPARLQIAQQAGDRFVGDGTALGESSGDVVVVIPAAE